MEKLHYMKSSIRKTAYSIHCGLEYIKYSTSTNTRVTAFVDLLILAGIKIIAFDFDLTMITGNNGLVDVYKNPNHVLDSLSIEFNLLATTAKKKEMLIACPTLSEGDSLPPRFLAGEALVKKMLERCNATFTIDGFYCYNPHNYQTEERYRAIGLEKPMPLNKHYHLNEIAKDFGVARSEILLIDSNKQHCVDALMHGFMALNKEPGFGLSIQKLNIPDCTVNLCTII